MTPLPTRLSAVNAIIRKDLHLLWPLALIIAAMQLGLTLFVHEVTEFPGAHVTEHPILTPSMPLYWIGAAVPALLSAIFVFLAVHTDIATLKRHDWLTRPINAVEIVAAKTILVLGVIFVPFLLGTTIFTLVHGADPALSMLPVAIMLRNCLFGIVLTWLVSGILQAVAALIGFMVLQGVLWSVALAVAVAIYFAARAHAGLPPGGTPEMQATLPAWARILLQLALVIAVMGPVLWLLLVRRRMQTARLLFCAAALLGSAMPFLQFQMAVSQQSARIAPAIDFTPLREMTRE